MSGANSEVATHWWRDAVIYQIYPRSWADADGDGVGDLPGITARLDHLAALGVDALWISPFYTSPQNDAGYDVADYRDVDPLFGTLADADALLDKAHRLGLRVIVDLVPNHSSSEHAWFQAALASPPGSPERARYLFRDGRGERGDEPPNNWQSLFGGPAWERIIEADGTPGQWYLHLFDVSQPDFDWSNPEVGDEMESVIRFWLDRGVDGFRIDVAHGLVKAAGLPDEDHSLDRHLSRTDLMPMWDRDEVHDVYRRWRNVVEEYDGDRVLVGEAWVTPAERLARYVRADELHQTFNFDYLMTPWLAPDQRAAITASLAATASVGAPTTWVLSNHDVVRHATRLGYPQRPGPVSAPGIGAADPQPDRLLGVRRARAATMVMLALPGSAYLYQGEELGLPDATELPDEARQDPTFARTGGRELGRDGCRVPIPWEGASPGCGFGPSASTWLPQPKVYAELAVDRQQGAADSTLELYRALLALRHDWSLGQGVLSWPEELADDAEVLRFTVTTPRGAVAVLANVGSDGVRIPNAARVLASSAELGQDGTVPRDVTVWLSND
ncbi:glycoside hydrolase family 13 protein [Nocardioides sp. Bht2]|uniref:glycoside hydrolase family 13 protein n=1 Tax=Nocardioides sp. Bht2 TaxID=3392297 RepID=UPI0039B5002F